MVMDRFDASARRSRRDVLKLLGGVATNLALVRFGVDRTGSSASQAAPGTPTASPMVQQVVVNGTEMAYMEQGDGMPVVFVHGSLNDFRSWGMQMPAFAAGYRAIAYSRRYHWPNAGAVGGAGYAAEEHVEDLTGFIAALGVGPVHLVGASYGALITLGVAAREPAMVRTLVLGEPPLLPWLARLPGGLDLLTAFDETVWQPTRQALAQGEDERAVRLFIDGAVGTGAFDYLPDFAKMMMFDNVGELRLETETTPEELFSALSPEDAAGVQTPTLILDGEYSPAVFRLITDELGRRLPNAESATILGTSHAMHAGNPEGFNEAVLGFLAKH